MFLQQNAFIVICGSWEKGGVAYDINKKNCSTVPKWHPVDYACAHPNLSLSSKKSHLYLTSRFSHNCDNISWTIMK